jgi:hypothetical protein
MRRLISGSRIIGWIGLALVVGLIPAVLMARPHATESVGAAGSSSPRASLTLDGGQSRAMATLPDDAYDLAYDDSRGLIWLAVMRISEPDWLYAVSSTGAFERWALPDSAHNGYLTQIDVDVSGAIWISQEYVLTRFDPGTEKVTSLSFDEVAPGSVPGALDPGNPLPGTWISAITPFGDGVLLARNNVATLVAYDGQLQATSTIKVPNEYAGARGLLIVPGGILALGGQSQLHRMATFGLDGSLMYETSVSGVPESRLAPAGEGAALVTGSRPSIVSADGESAVWVRGCGTSVATVAAVDAKGFTVCYDQSTATVRGDAGQQLAQLEIVEGEVWAPPPGGRTKVRVSPSLSDVIIDKGGVIWFFVLGTHELRAVEP